MQERVRTEAENIMVGGRRHTGLKRSIYGAGQQGPLIGSRRGFIAGLVTGVSCSGSGSLGAIHVHWLQSSS